jgi:formylglycine-generating enzyme required for sulfatase activity
MHEINMRRRSHEMYVDESARFVAMLLLLALLFAAPSPAKSDLSTGLVAVLEFRNKLKGDEQKNVDAGFLADEVRELMLKAMPGLHVMTRENMLVLLQASGKKLEECEGECEVDTGRRIGADLVVSGELLRFGSAYKLDLKLHETREGRLIAGAIASGKTVDELDAGTGAAVAQLIGPLKASVQNPQVTNVPARTPQGPVQNPPPGNATNPPVNNAQNGVAANPPSSGKPAPSKAQTPPPAKQNAPHDHPIMRLEGKSGLNFVKVFDGSGHLGCASADSACVANEKPARELGIGGFWIGQTEVTVAAYAACAKARVCAKQPEKRDVKETYTCNWHNRRHKHPMNCIKWDEAAQFCSWIGGRLPTAMEWEYAARSGEDVIYPWGNDPVTGTRANLCDKNCQRALVSKSRIKPDLSLDDGWAGTSPVGSYKDGASRWGLQDMAGNVAEWTASTLEGTNEKEIRGGSWASPARDLRSSRRSSAAPQKVEASLGFRCAL